MNITSAQYVKIFDTNTVIKASINGREWFIPMDKDNTEYAEIMRQVKEGILTIKDADE
jgi:hypothetical protein